MQNLQSSSWSKRIWALILKSSFCSHLYQFCPLQGKQHELETCCVFLLFIWHLHPPIQFDLEWSYFITQMRNTQFTEHSIHWTLQTLLPFVPSSQLYKVFNYIYNFWFKKIPLLLASFVHVLKLSLCITTWLLIEVAILLMHLPFWSTACWKLLNLKAMDLQTDKRYDLFQIWGYFITPSQHLPMDHINLCQHHFELQFLSKPETQTYVPIQTGLHQHSIHTSFPIECYVLHISCSCNFQDLTKQNLFLYHRC